MFKTGADAWHKEEHDECVFFASVCDERILKTKASRYRHICFMPKNGRDAFSKALKRMFINHVIMKQLNTIVAVWNTCFSFQFRFGALLFAVFARTDFIGLGIAKVHRRRKFDISAAAHEHPVFVGF